MIGVEKCSKRNILPLLDKKTETRFGARLLSTHKQCLCESYPKLTCHHIWSVDSLIRLHGYHPNTVWMGCL